jgi:hypothetical protein
VLKRRASVESEGGVASAGAEVDVARGSGAGLAAACVVRERRPDAPMAMNRIEIAKRFRVGRERALGIRNVSRLC